MSEDKPLARFKWNHQAALHRVLVKAANRCLKLVPLSVKYSYGRKMRAGKPPYSLIEGKTVVQIGAPSDTLSSGRARGMYFSLFAGPEAKVIVIEPIERSVNEFRKVLDKLGLTNTQVYHSAVWSEKKTLKIYSDPSHPATNFTEGTVDYDEKRLQDYEITELEADTMDNIAAACGIDQIDLISLTTNRAEEEILQGMPGLLAKGIPHICLAYGDPSVDYHALMKTYGYVFMAHDDRGMIFEREATT
ncbi:MAG: FkbM family methyltransferase [Kiritimatiellia bacterium]